MGFLAFLVPSISSLPSSFFLLLLVFPLCVCYILCVCPMGLGGSLPLPFFSSLWSLCLLVLGGSIRISVYPVSFLNCVRFIHKPIKDILNCNCNVFTSRFPSGSFFGFPSFCIPCLSLLPRSLLYPLASLAYIIIVVLKSLV